MNVVKQTIQMSDGREITIETGKLAKQADGSVVVRMGKTMLLATVVSKKEAKENVNFLPLSVDYQEKFASTGKVPGGFLKREARLSNYEILICRLVDRALRPLFPSDYHADTQIAISLISGDTSVPPDALAALAASSALAVSDIPFEEPVSEVRVVKCEGEFIVNPSFEIIAKSELDMMIAATYDNITMVEGEMKEVSEADMIEAIKVGHEAIKLQCAAQKELTIKVGKTEKRTYCHEDSDEDLQAKINAETYDKLYAVAAEQIANKDIRKEKFTAIYDEFVASLPEEHGYNPNLINTYFNKAKKKACRDLVLLENKRIDGRELTQVRPIWMELDYLPNTHGSAVFTRGETQSLTSVTLGTKMDEQLIDGAMISGTQKYILHYNFPGFSTGEVKPNRGPARREIGHGNLALRALRGAMPPESESPYAVRIVSDILESNGSSSMATVCAGSLALMDAGLPIKSGVSGIAMGMISDPETGNYAILSDILGDEDHLGDMDFKVTGTANGITACQMDIKVDGLPYEVLEKALAQAKEGRHHILGLMNDTISAPREELKDHAPRTQIVRVKKEMIGAIIGQGGKVIQEMQRVTNTTIVIEEVKGEGVVSIFATSQVDMDAALAYIEELTAEPEVGKVYTGKVKSIMPFGAFIEFMKGRDGLLHISEIRWERVENMDGVLEEGEEVQVKLVEVDRQGKCRLSRKVLLPKPEGYVERPPRTRDNNRGGGDRGGRRDDRGGRRDDRRRRD
jgi:polyribonucleotide nucleotidyltransferase